MARQQLAESEETEAVGHAEATLELQTVPRTLGCPTASATIEAQRHAHAAAAEDSALRGVAQPFVGASTLAPNERQGGCDGYA